MIYYLLQFQNNEKKKLINMHFLIRIALDHQQFYF